jgi:hypothetical protein
MLAKSSVIYSTCVNGCIASGRCSGEMLVALRR